MDFRLLGPLEVADAGSTIRLAEGGQRSVLVLLLLHRNEAVPSDRLIDALWGQHPPATAAKVLQNHVGQLRRALGDRGGVRLQTRGRGYAVVVEAGELDVERFERLMQAGSDALDRDEPDVAGARLREALALWRGPPLADVAYESFAQPEIARLEERRLVALEQRVDADLALGRHADVLGDLEALVAEHPLRERPRAQLMLALYRSGRQAEALESFQDARNALVGELGVEPGPALRELQEAILRHDAELAAAPAAWPRLRRRSWRGRALLAAGGTALLAAAVAAVLVELGGGGSSGAHVVLDLADNSIAAVDPASGHAKLAFPLPGRPTGVAALGDAAVVVTVDSRALVMADAGSRSMVRTVALRIEPAAIAAGNDSVWVADGRRGRLLQFRLGYELPVARLGWRRSRAGPTALAVGAGAIWVVDGSRRLQRFDARSHAATVVDTGVPLAGVTVGAGAVWTFSSRPATVVRVDARSGATTPIPIATRGGSAAPSPIGIAATSRAVWVLNANTATVTRIDAEQGGVTATIPIGVDRAPRGIAAAGETVWVANSDGTLTRIAAAGGEPGTVWVGESLEGIASTGGRVWVTTRALDRQIPGGPS
jgi:DNA-binding SARP family transcriptional activator/DNA-binding beta-propeller fold protein YncE